MREDYSMDSRLQKVICKDCDNLIFHCGFFCKLNLHEKQQGAKDWRPLLDWKTPLEECNNFIHKEE